jgi:SAM-dependent methyltransferase
VSSVAAKAPAARDGLVPALGWFGAVLHGDPCMFDRWRWLRRRLAAGPARTLDAGSGSGAFVLYAAARGNAAFGISFDRPRNAAARRRASLTGADVEIVDGDLRELGSFATRLGPFDQILSLETIEHVADDAQLVADMAALLAPGGRLLLTTPSHDYRPLLGDRLDGAGQGGHVRWGYTHTELRRLVERAGLELVEEGFSGGVVAQMLTNLMRLGERLAPHLGWALTLPLRPAQLLDPALTRLLRYPFLSVTIVARRPS